MNRTTPASRQSLLTNSPPLLRLHPQNPEGVRFRTRSCPGSHPSLAARASDGGARRSERRERRRASEAASTASSAGGPNMQIPPTCFQAKALLPRRRDFPSFGRMASSHPQEDPASGGALQSAKREGWWYVYRLQSRSRQTPRPSLRGLPEDGFRSCLCQEAVLVNQLSRLSPNPRLLTEIPRREPKRAICGLSLRSDPTFSGYLADSFSPLRGCGCRTAGK